MKIGIQHVLTLADCSLIKEFLNPKHKIGLGAKHLVVLVPFSKPPVKALGLLHKRPKVPGTRYQGPEKRGRQGGEHKACSALLSLSSPNTPALPTHACTGRENAGPGASQPCFQSLRQHLLAGEPGYTLYLLLP